MQVTQSLEAARGAGPPAWREAPGATAPGTGGVSAAVVCPGWGGESLRPDLQPPVLPALGSPVLPTPLAGRHLPVRVRLAQPRGGRKPQAVTTPQIVGALPALLSLHPGPGGGRLPWQRPHKQLVGRGRQAKCLLSRSAPGCPARLQAALALPRPGIESGEGEAAVAGVTGSVRSGLLPQQKSLQDSQLPSRAQAWLGAPVPGPPCHMGLPSCRVARARRACVTSGGDSPFCQCRTRSGLHLRRGAPERCRQSSDGHGRAVPRWAGAAPGSPWPGSHAQVPAGVLGLMGLQLAGKGCVAPGSLAQG